MFLTTRLYRLSDPHLENEDSTGASLVAQTVKNLPAVQETQVQFLDWEDPLEKGVAPHSSILAWRISMDRGFWWAIQSMGFQRVGDD